jgi:hypothetical protein
VATKTWSVLAEKLQVSSLAYYPKFDCLYGVATPLGGPPTLRQFEAGGNLIREYALAGEAIVPGSLGGRGPFGSSTQVVPVDEHVVIFAMPDLLRSSEIEAPPKAYMYLFHPKTGQTRVTWKN